jgi:hypothetical protein
MPDFDRFHLVFVAVPTVFAIIGLAAVGSGVRSIVTARRFLKVAQQVSGTVSDHRHRVHRRSDSDRDQVVTVPVLRFTTRTGQRVEAEQSIALRRGAPERGAEVGVLYDPGDPARAAVVGTANGVTADAVVRILVGTFFALVASNFLHPWVFTLFF